MKSKRSRTDPCGTPCVVGNLFELLSFMVLYWDLPERKL